LTLIESHILQETINDKNLIAYNRTLNFAIYKSTVIELTGMLQCCIVWHSNCMRTW